MADFSNRICNLECVDKAPKVHEFVGPVKIILMDPPKMQYCYRSWFSGLLSLANVLLTINFIIIFYYTIQFESKFEMTGHIYLCTLGLQYCMFIGTLLVNGLFGPAAPMKRSHRNMDHLLVEIAAIGATAGGIFIVSTNDSFFTSMHSLAGIMLFLTLIVGNRIGLGSFGLAVLSSIAGPTAHFFREGFIGKLFRAQHNFVGFLAIIMSSVCFIMGLIETNFTLAVDEMYIFMIVFCVIYTFIVILSPAMKFTDADKG